MTLDRDRPEILSPPGIPRPAAPSRPSPSRPRCNAKTAQKHDYPSAAHRRSYARRTGAERGFATAKDPATNNISRGWCRLMGLTPLMLFTTTLLIVRNQRILTAWDARQDENARRAAAGLPPKTRRRRRKTSPRRRRHQAALTRPATRTHRQHHPHQHPGTATDTGSGSGSMPGNHRANTQKPPGRPQTHTTRQQPRPHQGGTRMSDPNVKMVPTET